MLIWPEDAFPGTNLNDINLDWIIEQIKALDAKCDELDERVRALEEG